jgi:hypothetical protein
MLKETVGEKIITTPEKLKESVALSRMLLLAGLAGVLLGLLSIAYLAFLPEAAVTVHVSIVLAAVGTVYMGFGIADGRLEAAIMECFVAFVFWGIAILGALYSPLLLAVSFFAHALWDLAHHYGGVKTKVRIWYPPFCALYDCIVGLFLTLKWYFW